MDGEVIDLSFLPRALNELNGYLHTADAALRVGERNEALVKAGLTACAALRKLRDHPKLWDQLRERREYQVQQWQDLRIPDTLADLLRELGYIPPPPAEELVDVGDQALRQTVDAIRQARKAISELHDAIDKLTKSQRNRQRLMTYLGGARQTLAAAVVATAVLPGVEAGIHTVAPHAAELIHELVERAGAALSSLSIGLIAIPYKVDEVLRPSRGSRLASEPSPTAIPASPPDESEEARRLASERLLHAADQLRARFAGRLTSTDADLIRALDEAVEAARRLNQPRPAQPPSPTPPSGPSSATAGILNAMDARAASKRGRPPATDVVSGPG